MSCLDSASISKKGIFESQEKSNRDLDDIKGINYFVTHKSAFKG
jgi:hypothetical protein